VSQLVVTSEVRAVVGELRRQQVMDLVRGATFVGALLLAWVSLHPFQDLADMQIGDVSMGNEMPTYAAFGGFAVLTLILAMRDNMRGLASLLTPAFVWFVSWLCITVVLSLDPGTSIRRFALSACVMAVAAAVTLLPKSQNELMRWFSIAALVLLATCYLGIMLAPSLSIHLATDAQEPGLAGNWRGSFGHKNMAAGVMAMLVFLGIYIIRSGAWFSGVAIVSLASLFLLYSAGKSSLTLCLVVLLLTSLTRVVRSFWARAIMLLAPLLFLAGLAFGYFAVLPAAVKFLLGFNDTQFNIQVRAKEYYGFFAQTLIACGVVFQVPVGILAVTRLGIVKVSQLQRNRRYAYLACAVVAAALPGVDPVSMLLETAPLIALYELSIVLARLFGQPKATPLTEPAVQKP